MQKVEGLKDVNPSFAPPPNTPPYDTCYSVKGRGPVFGFCSEILLHSVTFLQFQNIFNVTHDSNTQIVLKETCAPLCKRPPK